jgi:multiple sugar transport system permease protein
MNIAKSLLTSFQQINVRGIGMKGKKSNIHFNMNEMRTAYLFLTPAIILFILFVLVPVVWVVYLSFTKYNIITPAEFVQWKNWDRLLSDGRLGIVIKNTAKFAVLLTPMHMIMGILLALGVNSLKSEKMLYFFRTVYYFPTLFTTAAVAMAWTFIFSKDLGMLNYYLSLVGVHKIPWMASSFWVYPAVMIFSLWKFVGIYFLYFLIGLQSIDKALLDAAEIDGASSWNKLIHVTLPMLSPTIFFVLTTMLIGVVQIFDEPYLLTQGGPGDASRSLSLYIYETAYVSHNYGYASAIAILLLVIVLIMTYIQFKGSNIWVNYDVE